MARAARTDPRAVLRCLVVVAAMQQGAAASPEDDEAADEASFPTTDGIVTFDLERSPEPRFR